MSALRYNKARAAVRKAFATTLMAGTALTFFDSFQRTSAQSAPAISEAVSVNIPAMPLAGALIAFSRQSRIETFVDSAVAAGKRSTAVNGTLAPQEALRRLLAGTGLNYRFSNTNTVTISDPRPVSSVRNGMNANGAINLDQIDVQGTRTGDSPSGPVTGLLATQSETATKTGGPLVETPQSITVVGAEQMSSQGVRTIEDAVAYTPGVKAEAFGFNPVYAGINIRGFEVFHLFRDGLGQFSNMQFEPFGLERVEVLRGPASVLYGLNPPGGLVNLVTKRPTADAFKSIEVSYGNFNRKQAAVDMSGPVDKEGHWLYRFTALGRLSDSQVDFINDDRAYVAPAFTWKPTSDTSLTVLANYQKDQTKYVPDVPLEGSLWPNPNGRIARSVYLGEPAFDVRKVESASIGYFLEHRFNEALTVKQNFRYASHDIRYRWTFGYSDILPFDGVNLDRWSVNEWSTTKQVAVDNQAILKFQIASFAHTVLAGVDYQRAKTDGGTADTYGFPFPIDIFKPIHGKPMPPLIPYNHYWDDQSRVGIYLQDQIKFDDRWILLLSGRKDYVETKQRDVNHLSLTETRDLTTDDAFTKRAALMHMFPAGFAPYVSYSESFEPVDVTTRSFDRTPFKPVTGVQYEAGIKYQPTGSKMLFTLAGFDLRQQNVVVEDPLHAGGYSIQIGEVRSRGVEAEANAEIGNWKLLGSYTYLDSHVTKDTDQTRVGRWLEGVPRHMANAWAEYKISGGTFAGLGAGAGVRYTGDSYNSDNFLTLPAHTLVDALLFYEWNKTRVALNVRNLFDDDTVKWCGEYAGPGYFTRCRFGTARTVVLTLKQSW